MKPEKNCTKRKRNFVVPRKNSVQPNARWHACAKRSTMPIVVAIMMSAQCWTGCAVKKEANAETHGSQKMTMTRDSTAHEVLTTQSEATAITDDYTDVEWRWVIYDRWMNGDCTLIVPSAELTGKATNRRKSKTTARDSSVREEEVVDSIRAEATARSDTVRTTIEERTNGTANRPVSLIVLLIGLIIIYFGIKN